MKTKPHLSHLILVSFLGAGSWTGTALSAPKIPASLIQPAISALDLQLDQSHLQQFAVPVQAAVIKTNMMANLAEWSYPLKAIDGHFSHRLEAAIGLMQRGSTPAGFSFSSGNSDPRSPDFQQADVIPISCSLSRSDDPSVKFELKSAFSAPSAAERTSAHLTHELSDRLSTLCYDLLDKLPRQALPKDSGTANPAQIKPNWIPNIRVEIQEKPLPAVRSSSVTEPEADDDGSQKSLLIHNQGDPLIITIGHERK